jgi:hypothetical protein
VIVSDRRKKNPKCKPENLITCYHCSYTWYYNGKRDVITCSRCSGQIKVKTWQLEHMIRIKIPDVGTIQRNKPQELLRDDTIRYILFNDNSIGKRKNSYWV